MRKKSVKSILNELRILKNIHSKFIVNVKLAFQDREFLYLGLDLKTGKDLRFHLINNRFFPENQSKFMIACVIQGNRFPPQKCTPRSTLKIRK